MCVDVSMTRHVFIARLDDVLTIEDVAQLSKLWTKGTASEGYEVALNLDSACVSASTRKEKFPPRLRTVPVRNRSRQCKLGSLLAFTLRNQRMPS